ncbi:MAG: RecX family transcriptional regulator [Pseudomonadota bacterium]
MVAKRAGGGDPEMSQSRGAKKAGKKRKPLNETTLRDLALHYAARFATTGAKLEGYLARKIRERGVAEDPDGRTLELDVPGLVTRLIELGYVNDDAYARAKSRDLTHRGYGARRVEQALWAAGVNEPVREAHAPSEAEARRAAILLAKKRRFGPFGVAPYDDPEPLDEPKAPEDRMALQKLRDKQIAAMLRAGHDFEHVRFILDASHLRDIEEWLSEAEAQEAENGSQESGLW